MKYQVSTFCLALAAVLAFVFTGCETESVKNNGLTITPVSVGLHNGEYADFTASGGYDYTWSLQNPTWGVLSNLTGPTTRYTDRYDPGSNGSSSAVQVLTVTSTVRGANSSADTTSSSNVVTDASNATTAQIEHLPTTSESESTETNTTSVTITPASATVTKGSSVAFTASGGTSVYTWSLSDSTVGTLTENGVSVVTFTSSFDPGASNSVSHILYATDSGGAIGTATITLTH